jgi:hypothetical protein
VWALILVVVTLNGNGVAITNVASYRTQASCEEARKEIVMKFNGSMSGVTATAICIYR